MRLKHDEFRLIMKSLTKNIGGLTFIIKRGDFEKFLFVERNLLKLGFRWRYRNPNESDLVAQQIFINRSENYCLQVNYLHGEIGIISSGGSAAKIIDDRVFNTPQYIPIKCDRVL